VFIKIKKEVVMSKMVKMLGVLFLLFFAVGCGQKNIQPPFEPVDLSPKFAGNYKAKADRFLVVFDASSSMFIDYNKEMKFKQSKRILNNMNQTIPAIDVTGGIRTFGPDPYALHHKTELLYGMSKYSRADFAAALSTVATTGGGTPLATAINLSSDDLGDTNDKIAVIVVSDAEDVGEASVAAAQDVKNKYKDQVCIYTILIGDAPGSRKLMADIANASGCGFATDYAALNSPAGMADFVEKVFLEKASAPKRAAAAAPAAKIAPASKDSDRDGVLDQWDSCPGTPYGLKVDKYGCPLPITKKTSIKLRVEFGVDKYFVQPQYKKTLREFANFMNDNPGLIVTIEGHTDSSGGDQYNQKLSEKRAQSVSQYLTTYYKVAPSRLKSIGYGESKPETTNETVVGKQKNRRVMAVIDLAK
jgi:OOP family OmpA-OmpF porin